MSKNRKGEETMANILIIGNGFDLYHGLPTRYTDFLTFVEFWNIFHDWHKAKLEKVNLPVGYKEPDTELNIYNLDNGKLTEDSVIEMAEYVGVYDENNIEFLNANLTNNKWIQYFEKTGYEKEGWIDFEREIESVLLKVELYFNTTLPEVEKNRRLEFSHDRDSAVTYIDSEYETIFEIFGEGVELADINDTYSYVCNLDINNQFNRPKQKKILLDKMKKELDTLIKCFRIYTMEFIEKFKITKECDKIKNLGKLLVLNFNYTNTFEKVYKDQLAEMCYVHGSVKADNLVMGVSDDFIENNDYIYFQKFFQRIQKRTGIEYKDFFEKGYNIYKGVTAEVYIMGHSLDKTDKGVLEKFFDEKYKVNIFYHAQWAYEEQVIKLVEMFGKERIIDAVAKKEIEFIDLNKKESKDLEPN